GVLVLGLRLTTVAGLAGEKILAWLGVASGALVAVLGAGMLANLIRRRGTPVAHHHHDHGHSHSHSHGHSHGEHSHGHDSDHGVGEPEAGHHHHGERRGPRPNRLSLASMGIAGGPAPRP